MTHRAQLRAVLLSVAITGAFDGPRLARAHSPHDEIEQLVLSPDWHRDGRLCVVVRGNLMRTDDAALSWRRLDSGLDNAGTFTSLAFLGASPETLLAAAADGPLYLSSDGGIHWERFDLELPARPIVLLAALPGKPGAALASDREGRLILIETGARTGRTVLEARERIAAVAVSGPAGANRFLALGERGAFYCAGRADEWQAVECDSTWPDVTSIAIDPASGSVLAFFVGTKGGGVWRGLLSEDRTARVRPASGGLRDGDIRSLLALRETDGTTTLFASTGRDGVYRSTDSGETWHLAGDGLTRDRQADDYRHPHFGALAASDRYALDGTIYLAGFDGLFRTEDRAGRWAQLQTLDINILISLEFSPGFASDGTVAVATYDGGAYLSPDAGRTWRDITPPADVTRTRDTPRLYQIAFAPGRFHAGTLFLSSSDAFFVSTDLGSTWRKVPLRRGLDLVARARKLVRRLRGRRTLLGGECGRIAVSSTFDADRSLFVGTFEGDIFRSLDGGETFRHLTRIDRPITHLVISPAFQEDRVLLAGTLGGVLKSSDGGRSWSSAGAGISLGGGSGERVDDAFTLAVSPAFGSDGTAFAASAAGLFVTRDGAGSWRRVENGVSGAVRVEALAVSPGFATDGTVVVSLRGRGLWRSIDHGRSFEPIAPDLLAGGRSIAPMRGFPPAVPPLQFSPTYASDGVLGGLFGTDLLLSADRGATWNVIDLSSRARGAGGADGAGQGRSAAAPRVGRLW